MNFMSRGLAWAQKQRQLHMTVDTLIGHGSKSDAKPLKATISQSETRSVKAGITNISTRFHFIYTTSEIYNAGLQLTRGLSIWVEDDYYEVVFEGEIPIEYNDPEGNDIILVAQKKRDRSLR